MEKVYDVIVIGAGVAGSTAALYLGRYARSVCVIGKDMGLSGVAGEVENWPGSDKINAPLLTSQIQSQAQKYGAEYVFESVSNVGKDGDLFFVELSGNKLLSRTLILASGADHKKLEVKGEEEFIGKGVGYCATCDGMFFKDQVVAVIGGSDAAAKAILYLSDIAKEVHLIYRGEKMRCEPVYIGRIDEKKNIHFHYNSNVKEILGSGKVEEALLDDETKLPLDGIFIEIGSSPCSQFSQPLSVKCDNRGYIVVNRDMSTGVEGVFAAGDVTNTPLRQLITASADGAIAANSVHEYLQKN